MIDDAYTEDAYNIYNIQYTPSTSRYSCNTLVHYISAAATVATAAPMALLALGAVVERTDQPAPPHHGQVEAWDGTDHVWVNPLVVDADAPYEYLLGGDTPLQRWPRAALTRHANIEPLTALSAHRRAWHTMGLRLVTASATAADRFVYETGPHQAPPHVLVPLGNDEEDDDDDDDDETADAAEAPDAATNDGMCGYVSDGGFVVADGEPFTPANPETSTFVADTHECVHAYRDAVPTTAPQRRFRRWMDAFEQRVTHRDDNQHFAAGSAPPDYTAPPRKRTRRQDADRG